MTIPAMPAHGASWDAWAAGIDAAARAAVPKWQPSTAYTAGDLALNPSGQIVSANATFTSGATYSAANWTIVTGGTVADATTGAKGIVQLAGDLAGTAAAPTVPGLSGKLAAASNLSDVASVPTARTNLGLATVAATGAYTDLSGKPTIPTVGAAGAGAAIALSSTDGSVTNARTPTAHASTHASGGADALTPAAIGAPAVFNVKGYGATGNGTTDDSAAIQSAVNAAISAGGGILWFPAGSFLIGTTLQVYSASNVVFQGQGTLLNNVSNAPMVRFRNVSYCGTAATLQWTGQWRSNSIALELDGSLYGDFAVRGDQWPTGINVITSASATQNSAFNDLVLDIANGIKGIIFQGSGTYYASNNRINRITWGSAGSGSPIGIDFQKYADTNHTRWAYISLNVAGAIGVLYNSASPSTDQQVYECHFEELILEGYATGTIGIKGNYTTNFGARSSFVRYRLSGSSLPTNSIAANSDIVFRDSNDGSNAYVSRVQTSAHGVTASRPSASAVGKGVLFFDDTLNKPIWSTGSVWVDATGATV